MSGLCDAVTSSGQSRVTQRKQLIMVRQTRRTDRCFLPAAGGSVPSVQFPVSPAQRAQPPPPQVSGSESSDSWLRCSTTTIEEQWRTGGRSHAEGPGSDPGSGEPQSKQARWEGNQEAAALTNRDKIPGSCDPAEGPGQQGAAELSEDTRAAQLQSVGSLKVTIQQSSESREFGQTDRLADRQPGGLHCHVCGLSCRSLQVFQEHMLGQEHLRKLQEITHNICLNTHTLLQRGRRPNVQRWCDTCQVHFSDDVIIHRRSKQHKVCKQLGRPFCPVCKRHFRTPRKFVEHMKSAEHKEQVHLAEVQEEELITVDAVGCFEEEEEQEEEEEAVEVADEEEEENDGIVSEGAGSEAGAEKKQDEEEYNPHQTYGSGFVVPVSGFVCRLCNRFFYREAAARHTHCRTHTHYLNLQNHRAQQKRQEDESENIFTPT
uniref:Cdkn1a interacting zinc finger protein 1b n=1 Tax=Iconisemion striatum TaxID=60296 RepID=A0A1A7WY36_9TELE